MLITDKPEDLPDTPNDLDDIDVDEDTGLSIDRYLGFGTSPNPIPNPPKRGEVVEYRVKVECVGESWKERADGEIRYRSELSILSVARAGEELPPDYEHGKKSKADAEREAAAAVATNQPALFDDGGPDTDTEDDDAGGRPPFSDGDPT